MNSSLVVPAIVHLLLVALLAVLPQAELAHPRRATRLGLGLLSGFASLIVTGQATLASDGTGLVVHPVLVGCAAFLWGPASGLVAAAVAVAGHGLASTTEWLQALAVAAASLCLGLVWQELQRRRHLAPALAVVGMAFSLPLVLLPWLADSLVAAWQRAHFPQGWEAILPWRYTLGVLLLAGGANLLRSRAQVLTALARREQDLVRALRASGGGRWEWDVAGQRLFYGGRLYRSLGLADSPDDATGTLAHLQLRSREGRRWRRTRHHPDDLQRLAPYLRRVLAGRETAVQAEFRMRDDQGRWRWLIARGHAVEQGVDGRVRRLSGMYLDITEQQQVRDELTSTSGLLHQAGWMARLGVWEEVPGAGIVYWSDVCFDVHGLSAGDALPRNYVDDFVAPEWRGPMREQMRRSLRESAPWSMELEIVRADDGRRRWVRAHGEPVIEAGRVVRIRGILQDIDEMRRATEELHASEERLARVFQLLPTPLGYTRRADGAHLDVNPAWEQLLGYTREQVLGRSAVEMGLHDPDRRAAMLAIAQERGELVNHEVDITTATGEQRTVLQTVSAVQLHGEACWLFALHDITERKRAEQSIREREELLSLTIEAAALGLWDWDLASGSITGDARWRSLLGLPEDPQLRPIPWATALAQADTAVVSRELERHLGEPHQPFDLICRVSRDALAERWIRSLGKVVSWSAEGEPQRMVGMTIDVTSQRAQEQQLERMAHYDALTGLANRVLLERRLREGMQQCDAYGTQLGVGYLDLDGFKPINDRLGHAAGDRLLVQVAERLKRTVRLSDCVARLGGDEFVILLHGLPGHAACEQRMRALLESIAMPYILDGERVMLTASIGYTLYPDDGADGDTLLRHADQAMYIAKQAGRNRFHAFDAAHERAEQARRDERARLLQALQDEELALYLQPKVDMHLGVVVGAEALARWVHPERGVLAPGQFLHLIEGQAELQAIFGEWVVDTALALIARLMHDGLPLPVSINITPEHLHREGFADWVASRMALYPEVPARLLHVELTESAALYDLEHAARELRRLRALGVGVSFDDFGTGYSSLAYLRRLPMDHLKLDRSFVSGMLSDAGDRAIVQGVIGLGRSFGCDTIAEGVETVEQGRMLLRMGCRLAQGYCIARPMPSADFAAWARHWRAPGQWSEAEEIIGIA
ncbi:EAL domain-containing protein [Melaminivora sp.]|uniref:EAL domain-containing protein n=1 Tax=Melaminivora sp. TaxID=1933032 RepID=UPI0028ACD54A|nr:EAL domain-containing protein [Melaminivora sp.]